jgi:protein-tyrosine kinase
MRGGADPGRVRPMPVRDAIESSDKGSSGIHCGTLRLLQVRRSAADRRSAPMFAFRPTGVLRARGQRAALTFALVAAVLSALALAVPVRYEGVAQVLLTGASGPQRGPSAQAVAGAATQVDILTSQRVALMAVDALGLARDPVLVERWRARTQGVGSIRHHWADMLRDGLDVRATGDSSVIRIAFTDADPAFAAAAANALARAYLDLLEEMALERGRRSGAASTPTAPARVPGDPPAAVLLSAAVEPERPIGPSTGLRLGIALLAGVLAGVGAAWRAEARDRRVRSLRDAAQASDLPLLAVVRGARSGRAADAPPTAAGSRRAADAPADRSGAAPDSASARALDPPTRPMYGPDGPGPDRGIARDPRTGRVDAAHIDRDRPDGHPVRAWAPRRAAAVRADEPVLALASEGGLADASAPTARSAAGGSSGAGGARPPIGQILVQAGLIHPPEVERIIAWARQEGVRFGEAAVANRLVTPQQLERALEVQFDFPVLRRGLSAVSEEVGCAYDAHQPLSDDLRRLRARIRAAQLEAAPAAPLKAIAVVSAGRGEGKTFVAANLAASFAQAGQRTLLIDADLHRGRLHRVFGLRNDSGLSAMLNRSIVPGALQRVPALGPLTVLTRGPDAPNPSELLSRDSLGVLLEAFARSFDVVLVDTPGIAEVPDATLIVRRAGAALVVARQDVTAFDGLAELTHGGAVPRAALLGLVLDAG